MIDKLTHEDQKRRKFNFFTVQNNLPLFVFITLMTLFESRLVVQLVFSR